MKKIKLLAELTGRGLKPLKCTLFVLYYLLPQASDSWNPLETVKHVLIV